MYLTHLSNSLSKTININVGYFSSDNVLLNQNFAINPLVVDNNTKCIIKNGNKKASVFFIFQKNPLKSIVHHAIVLCRVKGVV